MTTKLETCVYAAIRLKDGTIIKGRRHGECFKAAFVLGYDHINSVQGFLTSEGRFVDRKEGRRLQNTAGIQSVSPDGYRGDVLFSEDLY